MNFAHKLVRITVFLLLICIYTEAQIPNGTWRDHLAYNKGQAIAISPDKVFCGFENGGMLVFSKQNGEIEKLSRVNGLSDIDISCLNYSSHSKILIIAYSSGNVDLLNSDGRINIPDIKRKSLTGSKRINTIKVYENLAYLACDFGIVVIDLKRIEIKDSYFFGPGGTNIKVNDLVIADNHLYAATQQGLYKVDMSSPNLLDHSFWKLQTNVPVTNAAYKNIASYSNKIISVYTNSSENDEVHYLENDIWLRINNLRDTLINSVEVTNNQFIIVGEQELVVFGNNLLPTQTISLNRGKKVQVDSDGTMYSASFGEGFLKHQGTTVSKISINCPLFNPLGQVATKDDHVWVTSGGPNNIWGAGGGYNFYQEKWISLITGWGGGLADVGNFYKIAYHPTNPNKIYASGYTYGLFEVTDNNVTKEYRYSNTPLFQSTFPSFVDVRIMGLDFDKKGNLWTIFDETDQPVYLLRNSEEWENPELSSPLFNDNGKYIDLLVTETNQVWILSKRDGIVVLNEKQDGSISERRFTIKNQDNEAISISYCLAEDKNGYIWVGTNKGPVFYPPMNDIFERSEIVGNSVKLPRGDGTSAADYLLNDEIVNDIAVDGANRKWLATENSGVFLVSSDGLKTVHQFTEKNSPMLSNNIISIGVQEKTGEVFISTNKGLLSFMGTATEGLDDFKDVYVYPNPIRPGYSGDITVTGLIENANVKITDISGNLVYEATSLGGQAIWNGKNFDGNRVHTGVYLVFMTNDDGSKTYITKLVFIH